MCRDRKASGLGPEAALFEQAQAGCEESLNALMSQHDGLVLAVVSQQALGELSYAEAIHAGRQGLWKAILGYAPERGYAFSTYAWPSIMRRVWRAVKRQARKEPPSPSDQTEVEGDPEKRWEAKLVEEALHQVVEGLPELLRWVVVARYGLNGEPAATYAQMGRELGLTRERVRQLHTEALVRLRQPAYSDRLRSILGRHTVADYEQAEEWAQSWLKRRGGRSGRQAACR